MAPQESVFRMRTATVPCIKSRAVFGILIPSQRVPSQCEGRRIREGGRGVKAPQVVRGGHERTQGIPRMATTAFEGSLLSLESLGSFLRRRILPAFIGG